MVRRISTPAHAGDREQARELVAPLGADLAGVDVVLDCAGLLVGTPSFLDELLKQVLVERSAASSSVLGASDRVQRLVERSAGNRAVADRVMLAVRS